MPSPCPTVGELAALVEGDLSPAETARLEQHLQDCAGCRRQLDLLAGGHDSRLQPEPVDSEDFAHLRGAMNRLKARDNASTKAAPPDTILPRGAQLVYLGDYEILNELGRGGMGVVYRARQTSLQREVALKVILAGRLASAGEVRRFHIEAEAAAKLDHPHILPIYEIGEHEGHHFFSMKLVEGRDLAEIIAGRRGADAQTSSPSTLRAPPSTGKPKPSFVCGYEAEEVAKLVGTVARAVHYAHQRGVLHRDVKPSNILIDAQGQPHLTDFGLAKIMEHAGKLTQSAAVMGTPNYMAPEQAAGNVRGITTAADVYSLGTVLYEMLAGQPPFLAETPVAVLQLVLQSDAPSPAQLNPAVPGDLATICLRCLEKDPARRYHSAELLADELDRFVRGEPILARPSTSLERMVKWTRRKPGVAALTAAVVITVVTGIIGIELQRRKAVEARAFAEEKARAETTARLEAQRSQAAEAAARQAETQQRQQADDARAAAEKARGEADALRAGEAQQRRLAEYESYVAKIGFAAAKIENREIGPALEILESCPAGLRHWEWGRLKHLCQLEQRSFASKGRLRSASISPDGTRVLMARSGSIREASPGLDLRSFGVLAELHDIETGRELAAFQHSGNYQSVLFLADGRRAVTTGVSYQTPGAGGDLRSIHDAKLWDLTTGKEVRRFVCDWDEFIHCAAVSPDGRKLALGGVNARTKLFEIETGTELTSLATVGVERPPNHGKQIWTMSFSPDGRLLVTGGEFATQVWAVDTGKEVHRIRERRMRTLTVLFSPDGRYLFRSDGTGAGQFWSVGEWQMLGTFLLDRPVVQCAAFSSDSQRLAVGTSEGEWVVFEAGSSRQIVSVANGHSGPIRSVAFAKDGRRLLTASDDRTAKLWELDSTSATAVTAVERLTLRGHSTPVLHAAFSPDDKRVLTASEDGHVKLWSSDAGHDALTFTEAGATAMVAALSPDDRFVLSASKEDLPDSRIRYNRPCLWNVQTGELVAKLPHQPGTVTSLAFSSDSRLAIVRRRAIGIDDLGYADRVIGLWNIAEGALVTSLPALTNAWDSVALSPDGKRLYTGSIAESAIWSVETGLQIARLKGARHYLGYAVFSPDGGRLVTKYGHGGETDGEFAAEMKDVESSKFPNLKVWDSDSGLQMSTLHDHVPRALTILPDNRRVMTQGFSSGLLWDLETGQRLRQVNAGPGVFSPDARRFCSSYLGKVLEFETDRVVTNLRGHGDRSAPSSFSSDGRRVWTSSVDGTARLWDADTGRELLTLKTGLGKEAKPVFSSDGLSVLLIVEGRARLLPARPWQ